jgi:hypothetical protein
MTIDPSNYEATNTVANPRTEAIKQNAIIQKGILKGGGGTVAISSTIDNPTTRLLTQTRINADKNSETDNFGKGGKPRRRHTKKLRKRKSHKKRHNKKKKSHKRK